MVRSNCCRWLIVAIVITGCNTSNKLAANKSPQGPNPATTGTSSSIVGSADVSASNKLKDPTKIHLAYAAWHEQTGNFQEARQSYKKVLDKNPKNTEALLGLARVDLAYGMKEEADVKLKKALKYHPKDPQVLVAIGEVHASRNEWAEALEKMQAAHKLEPYNTVYLYHLAVVEARTGAINPAIEHFKLSVGEAEAYYNVGYILNEQGRTAEAESQLMKALKLKPELKRAESTLMAIRTGKTNDVQHASFSDK